LATHVQSKGGDEAGAQTLLNFKSVHLVAGLIGGSRWMGLTDMAGSYAWSLPMNWSHVLQNTIFRSEYRIFLERILHRSQELCKFSFEYFLQSIEQASSKGLKNQNFIPDVKLLFVLLRKAFANVFKLKTSRALYFSEVG